MYAGNNPILFVDFNGEDYGIIVDHQNKKITIKANYYTQDGITTHEATQQWNNWQGTFTTKGGEEYSISFDLSTDYEDFPLNSAESDPIGNFVEDVDNDQKFNEDYLSLGGTEDPSTVGGYTVNGKVIRNKKSVANNNTRSHEIGHTLKLKDNEGGVMNYASSFNSMSSVTKRNVNRVVRRSMRQVRRSGKGKEVENGVTVTTKGKYKGKGSFTRGKIEIEQWE